MFNRIDRYISGMFWLYFIAALVIFITLFTTIDALSTLVSYRDAEPGALVPYYAYGLPEIIYRMSPVACLMATIFTLSTLNKNNELVALYASGMSLMRINLAIFFGVVVISFAIFFISDRVLPNFTKQKNFIFYHKIKKNPSLYSMVRNSKIWYRSKDSIFNIKTLNAEAKEASGLTLYYFNENWDLIQMLGAEKVKINDNQWILENGSVTVFTEESSFPLTTQFEKKTILMSEDAKDLTASANTADVLSLEELAAFIKRNKDAGLDTVSYEVDYYSKYSFSLAALVMTIVGIPFSVTRARAGGAMLNVGICLGVVFLYWTFLSSALTLGKHGAISPILAAWVPNTIMAIVGLFVIRRK
jgi:lipopolysaccharide export system permease protein